ncbi:hypothetical protein ASE07_21275 [Noviherbaspirillum sp. Root189]|nr:hypothetical protein ASE07_21275 [Noviherbaspirillum sp. Root189]
MVPRATNKGENDQCTSSINKIFVKHVMHLQITGAEKANWRVAGDIPKYIAIRLAQALLNSQPTRITQRNSPDKSALFV